jgi:hypothetical protein
VGLGSKQLLLVHQVFINICIEANFYHRTRVDISNATSLERKIPKTINIIIIINCHHKLSRVSVIKENPKATLNREHD